MISARGLTEQFGGNLTRAIWLGHLTGQINGRGLLYPTDPSDWCDLTGQFD